jgi:dihydrofolate reductase
MLSIIVAMGKNRVIGKDNQMPWHLPEDLAYFKKVTMGSTVIMGKKTYYSIGKALPGRRNIVLSRDLKLSLKDAEIAHDIKEAATHEAFIIGGASIFEQTLDMVDRLYITHIDSDFEGDRKFPRIDWDEWQEISHEELTSSTGIQLRFSVYQRI